MKNFRYNNIFIYSSLQFCGNIEEYFAKNSKSFIAFVVLPRLNSKSNLIRKYVNGILVSEISVRSSSSMFIYYLLWYINYLKITQLMFDRKEKLIVLSMHPISFFGIRIQKLFRNIEFGFWIGDYFPTQTIGIKIYEYIKKHYHDRLAITYYLSDGINKVFNKKIINSAAKRTIMWGVKPKKISKRTHKSFNLLFVGLIKDSQGIDFLLDFLHKNKEFKLNIIGICDKILYKKYIAKINILKISDRVYFPNRFFSDIELDKIAKKCNVGIALYNIDSSNPTYYTDPGKVKAYAEMGIPVIMTKVSGVAKYIEKFQAGILIDRDDSQLESALLNIRENYSKYLSGIIKFNKYFEYESYYKNAFKVLEK